jgi:predicted RNase H-related nuclease YkuK (DUF458 family)
MRLWKEVENSLAVAAEVRPVMPLAQDGNCITVHADSNTDEHFKSARYTPMLVGIIRSMGYDYRVKPAAWATWVADRHCKNKTTIVQKKKR